MDRPLNWPEQLLRCRGRRGFGRLVDRGLPLLGVDIPPTVQIGRNLSLVHGAFGLVVHENTVIGDDVKLYQGVTIGRLDVHLPPERTRPGGRVVIRHHVIIGANAVVLYRSGEDLTIGEDAVIGAGAVVNGDSVGAGEIWAGNPARKVADR
jgi:serine O-acetyltransferase